MKIMLPASILSLPWLIFAAALGAAAPAHSEPAHLACDGATSTMGVGTDVEAKSLLSLVIDLGARTAKVEGHPAVPIRGPVDEDLVAFASPKTSDDVLDGTVNRITGEVLIYFVTNPAYKFHGRCHRPQALF
jgi:hypothetical protein